MGQFLDAHDHVDAHHRALAAGLFVQAFKQRGCLQLRLGFGLVHVHQGGAGNIRQLAVALEDGF